MFCIFSSVSGASIFHTKHLQMFCETFANVLRMFPHRAKKVKQKTFANVLQNIRETFANVLPVKIQDH